MDKDKSGELDAKEIAQSKFRVSRFSNAWKWHQLEDDA